MDNVTLLAKGGAVAYSGKRADAVPYFTSIGYPMPSEFFNPADHMLDIVSVDPRPEKHEESKARVRAMTNGWEGYVSKETGDEDTNPPNESGTVSLKSGSRTTPMRIALPVVLTRHWKSLWRQKQVFINRFIQGPFVGALFILFFQRLSLGPQGEAWYICLR